MSTHPIIHTSSARVKKEQQTEEQVQAVRTYGTGLYVLTFISCSKAAPSTHTGTHTHTYVTLLYSIIIIQEEMPSHESPIVRNWKHHYHFFTGLCSISHTWWLCASVGSDVCVSMCPVWIHTYILVTYRNGLSITGSRITAQQFGESQHNHSHVWLHNTIKAFARDFYAVHCQILI